MTPNDETREKFLAAVAERLTPDTIAEAHVFPPMRQGGIESGVAVIAVQHGSNDGPSTGGEPSAEDLSLTSGEAAAENSPRGSFDSAPARAENEVQAPAENAIESRLTVYTAKYRLTLKGPDRGKWEFALQAEADAPLLTVDKVVRGVQQRSGDAEEPLRLSGDEFRALLPLTP
jgi:hypothetical protein